MVNGTGACDRECDEQLRHWASSHVRQFTAPKVGPAGGWRRRAGPAPDARCAHSLIWRAGPPGHETESVSQFSQGKGPGSGSGTGPASRCLSALRLLWCLLVYGICGWGAPLRHRASHPHVLAGCPPCWLLRPVHVWQCKSWRACCLLQGPVAVPGSPLCRVAGPSRTTPCWGCC